MVDSSVHALPSVPHTLMCTLNALSPRNHLLWLSHVMNATLEAHDIAITFLHNACKEVVMPSGDRVHCGRHRIEPGDRPSSSESIDWVMP